MFCRLPTDHGSYQILSCSTTTTRSRRVRRVSLYFYFPLFTIKYKLCFMLKKENSKKSVVMPLRAPPAQTDALSLRAPPTHGKFRLFGPM
jgi:hypothetical protein